MVCVALSLHQRSFFIGGRKGDNYRKTKTGQYEEKTYSIVPAYTETTTTHSSSLRLREHHERGRRDIVRRREQDICWVTISYIYAFPMKSQQNNFLNKTWTIPVAIPRWVGRISQVLCHSIKSYIQLMIAKRVRLSLIQAWSN